MAVIKFFVSDEYETALALSLIHHMSGEHDVDFIPVENDYVYEPELAADMACFVGMGKAPLKHSLEAHGVPWVFFGPSYRHRGKLGCYRMAVCDIHPLNWLKTDRFVGECFLDRPMGWTNVTCPDNHILICGAGEAFHDFMNLPSPTVWLDDLVKQIREYTDRKILFRPKPGHVFDVPGVELSTMDSLTDDMEKAHCMVVHSANTCLDAFDYGLPCVVTGHGVTKSVALELNQIETLPTMSQGDWLDLYQMIKACEWDVGSGAGNMAGYGYLLQQLVIHPRTKHLFT